MHCVVYKSGAECSQGRPTTFMSHGVIALFELPQPDRASPAPSVAVVYRHEMSAGIADTKPSPPPLR